MRHQSPVNFRAVPSGFLKYSRKNTGSGGAVRSDAVHRDLADLARGHFGAGVIDDRNAVAGIGRPIDPGLAGHSVCELPTM